MPVIVANGNTAWSEVTVQDPRMKSRILIFLPAKLTCFLSRGRRFTSLKKARLEKKALQNM